MYNCKAKNFDNLKGEIEIDEHLISIPELCVRYNTNHMTGLTNEQVKINFEKYGKNIITPPAPKSNYLILLENFTGWFNILLWFGSALCFITAHLESKFGVESGGVNNNLLGVILASVVLVTGFFSYSQEKKSSKIMDSFKNLLPASANVIRNNVKKEILAEELVIGDLVEIKGGDQVPADIRLITNHALKVDNSSITGESDPQPRSLNAEHHNPLEARNLMFFSTNCLEGDGTGIVIRIGETTCMGRIAILTTGLTHEITPLTNDIQNFIIKISLLAIFFAIIFFIACLIIGFSFLKSMIYFITIVVANVPEGLLPTLTLALTLTAKRMARKNCLIKSIQAVETLGSTSVICTDKTGTLTQNKMTVAHIWYSNETYIADILIKRRQIQKVPEFWEPLIRNAALCSKAEFQANQDKVAMTARKVIGDSSEVAILKFLELSYGSVKEFRKSYTNLYELPFNSTNKFSLSICEEKTSKKTYLLMKGASERIIERCSTILVNGQDIPLDNYYKEKFNKAYLNLGGCGERVIGFCDFMLNNFEKKDEMDFENEQIPKNNYRFLGLISMIDPPRPSVPNAVFECRSAGIKIIMVTGDHPITAKAIAKSVGIISTETRDEVAERKNIDVNNVSSNDAGAVVISGEQLKQMNEQELINILTFEEIIFARTSPQQKLSIVEGCQKMGYIVAVTGDGVNDSPALKKANIGVAMGVTGSDVSKQAADIILLDDNFSSIVTGIEEGRTIFDNLKKSVCYTLSSKLPQMMPFLFFVVFGIPLGMSAVTILCIDLGTDIFPSVSLAYEPPESDIMRRAPRNVKSDNLINVRLISVSYLQLGIIQIAAGFFSYFCLMTNNGFVPKSLFGIRKEWDDTEISDLEDSYGQEWSYSQRKTLEKSLYTVFFIAIIMTKVLTLISCKTRKLSILSQGFSNNVLNLSLAVEIILTIVIVSTPKVNDLLQMYPIPLLEWFYPIPFSILVIIYDEFRRYLIRNYPRGFFFNQTYY